MKIAILAGGKGTRLMDETHGVIPKPMIEVGGIPMLLHIMRTYDSQMLDDSAEFHILAGYKKEVIFDWAVESGAQRVVVHDTGENTMTGGRLFSCVASPRGGRS